MNDKEKLVELLGDMWQADSYEEIADHLIANGVTIPVRCKDCKYLNVLNRPELYAHCRKTNTVFRPFDIDTREHFCACGERENND